MQMKPARADIDDLSNLCGFGGAFHASKVQIRLLLQIDFLCMRKGKIKQVGLGIPHEILLKTL